MSIGVDKVNGGVISGQWTEGALTYHKVVGPAAAFAGTFGLTPTEGGPRPAPESAAEVVYRVLSAYGTPVIFNIVSDTEIHVAMAYGASYFAANPAAALDATNNNIAQALQGAGPAADGSVTVQKFGGATVTGTDDVLSEVVVDFSAATVSLEPGFELV